MRYNQLRNTESLKDVLFEDLLNKCAELQLRNEDLARQLPPPDVDYKEIATTLTDMINRQTLLVRNRISINKCRQTLLTNMLLQVVLIDGNSLIFQSYLLRQGSKGGQQAADIFKQKLSEWAKAAWPQVTMDGTVVRVFANVKVLAEKCRKANLVPSTDVFGECLQVVHPPTMLTCQLQNPSFKVSITEREVSLTLLILAVHRMAWLRKCLLNCNTIRSTIRAATSSLAAATTKPFLGYLRTMWTILRYVYL